MCVITISRGAFSGGEGEVTIKGKVLRLSEVKEIERVTAATAGVTAVHLDKLMSSTRD